MKTVFSIQPLPFDRLDRIVRIRIVENRLLLVTQTPHRRKDVRHGKRWYPQTATAAEGAGSGPEGADDGQAGRLEEVTGSLALSGADGPTVGLTPAGPRCFPEQVNRKTLRRRLRPWQSGLLAGQPSKECPRAIFQFTPTTCHEKEGDHAHVRKKEAAGEKNISGQQRNQCGYLAQ